MDPHTIAVTWRLVFVCLTVLFCWLAYWDYRKKRLEFEERRLSIEKGMEPPPRPVSAASGWPGVKQQELQLKYAERRLLIEKGIAVPFDPPPPPPKPLKRIDYLRRGITATCLAVGVALAYVALARMDGRNGAADAQAWCLGIAPILLLYGIGSLIYQRYAPEGPAAHEPGTRVAPDVPEPPFPPVP